ncbi:hypothetical protein QBC45DRAFT_26322 [Copromyces sp. CBS 386.78]|nr:hypothetical protein QBC45DRAFT_26322 [Copromyces sp. CBS 386.78]
MASHSSATSRQMQDLQEQLGSLSFEPASPAAYSTMGSTPWAQFENFRARRGGRKPKPRDRASPYPSVLTRRIRPPRGADRRRPVAAKRRNDFPQRTNRPKNRNDVVKPRCVRCGKKRRRNGSYRCRKCVKIPDQLEYWDAPNYRGVHNMKKWNTQDSNKQVTWKDCLRCNTKFDPVKHKEEECFHHPGHGELARALLHVQSCCSNTKLPSSLPPHLPCRQKTLIFAVPPSL